MRKSFVLVLAVTLLATMPVFADVQNVEVGGSIRIRGNAFFSTGTTGTPLVPGGAPEVRWPAAVLPGRPIGGLFGGGVVSLFDWDDNGNNLDFVEQRTRLNVTADFTDNVRARIELDSYDIWGEDFRSDYLTGVDGRAASVDDVEVYQAYIQASEMFGYPIRLRVGRQKLTLGSQWLVGENDKSAFFRGLSFDAVRLTYSTDMVSVNAWWSKVADVLALEEDGDVDFYGIYGSYKGLEDLVIDAYWLYVRDATGVVDTGGPRFAWWNIAEDILGLDDYDATEIHTIGLRGAGTYGAFDYEAEVAYQWGSAATAGVLFAPFIYGDDSAEYDTFGGTVEVGYTFDINYQPRVYLGLVYLGGEDNRDLSFFEWVLGPFNDAEASVSFNRLFSNVEYSEFLENSDLSNVFIIRGGVSAMPTESLELLLSVAYFQALEEFDAPWNIRVSSPLGGPDIRIPLLPALSFLTQENDSDLGVEVGLYATYNYTEDLVFRAGWAHLFVGDGLDDGQFVAGNGLLFNGGTGDDDADYVFVETELKF